MDENEHVRPGEVEKTADKLINAWRTLATQRAPEGALGSRHGEERQQFVGNFSKFGMPGSTPPFFKNFFFNKFIYILFLAVLGLCCCVRAFSSCREQGLLFIVVHGLLIAVASLVAELGL